MQHAGLRSNKVCLALNSLKLPMNGARILVLGISYKKNVDDCREALRSTLWKTKRAGLFSCIQ